MTTESTGTDHVMTKEQKHDLKGKWNEAIDVIPEHVYLKSRTTSSDVSKR